MRERPSCPRGDSTEAGGGGSGLYGTPQGVSGLGGDSVSTLAAGDISICKKPSELL